MRILDKYGYPLWEPKAPQAFPSTTDRASTPEEIEEALIWEQMQLAQQHLDSIGE